MKVILVVTHAHRKMTSHWSILLVVVCRGINYLYRYCVPSMTWIQPTTRHQTALFFISVFTSFAVVESDPAFLVSFFGQLPFGNSS